MAATSWMTAVGSGTVLYPFAKADGQPEPRQVSFDRITRPGVAGVTFWQRAATGTPFTVRTVLDCLSQAAAITAAATYTSAVGTEKDLYLSGFDGTKIGKIFIHKVKVLAITQNAAAVGGVNGGRWELVVEWTLEVTGA